MAKKNKKSTDVNVTAFETLREVTKEESKARLAPSVQKAEQSDLQEKNPAAVALGRLGGLKGGKARARKLSPAKRIEIAKKAAKSRWKAK
jgi:hypothetical protein